MQFTQWLGWSGAKLQLWVILMFLWWPCFALFTFLVHLYGMRWFSYAVLVYRSVSTASTCWSSGSFVLPIVKVWVAVISVHWDYEQHHVCHRGESIWSLNSPSACCWNLNSCSACHGSGSDASACCWSAHSGCHKDWNNCNAFHGGSSSYSPCWSLSPSIPLSSLRALGCSQWLNPRFPSPFRFPTNLFQRYSEVIERDRASLIWRQAERGGVVQHREEPSGAFLGCISKMEIHVDSDRTGF